MMIIITRKFQQITSNVIREIDPGMLRNVYCAHTFLFLDVSVHVHIVVRPTYIRPAYKPNKCNAVSANGPATSDSRIDPGPVQPDYRAHSSSPSSGTLLTTYIHLVWRVVENPNPLAIVPARLRSLSFSDLEL